MAKLMKVRRLIPRVQQVLDLMLKHADDNGHVDWKRLNEQQPGWDDNLPSVRFVQSTAERLRRSGRFSYAKQGNHGEATFGPRPGMNTRGGDLLPHNEMLLQFILKYGDRDGYVNYKELEAEVPNWWKKHWDNRRLAVIAFNSVRASKRGRAELAKRNALAAEASAQEKSEVVKASALSGKAEITPEIRAVMDKEISKEISKQVRQKVMLIMQDCRYCPRCKKDMGILFQGALVEQHINE